ncbi:MAG: Type 1 glutamine amidotransferase-like domain-containing protein [Candidatus Diapherotrites archaeon]|nr:Type 1 glutamine amidotransferase-like domain-containing protein [Candidatus Diapherotrites archaeon]
MKFYLSSYKLGTDVEKLKSLFPSNNKKAAYLPNALDFSSDLERRKKSIESDIIDLQKLGLEIEIVDLRDYFNKKQELETALSKFGVIWVRGGKLFVLRQAMKLSGFDEILKKLMKKENILYGGYSAGICVLGLTLKGFELLDDISAKPYGEKVDLIWEGLGIINYSIIPHFQSNHPESKNVDKAVEYMKKNNILFKTLRDGEAIILNN